MRTRRLITIALADDHAIVRKGIKEIILSFGNYKVDIEAGNGRELLQKIEVAPALPDICIIDVSMPIMNGYETLIELRRRWPDIKTLILTMYSKDYSIIKMIKNGANGYLLKNSDPKELNKALKAIYNYGSYHSELVTGRFIQMIQNDVQPPNINDKELEFLSYCCSELSYKEIAVLMNLSPRTVEGYRDVMFNKLKTNTRIGLVLHALELGITPYKKKS